MGNANYRKGYRLECLWKRQMERRGYTVTRSAGSHGKIDCIAWNDREIILAQIKASGRAWGPKDINELRRMDRPPGARVVLYERVGAGGVEWKEVEA